MKAIAIFSGKGGVGKSTIASLLATAISQKHKTVLLDADINTPSIPFLFGGKQKIGNLTLLSYGYDVKDGIPISLTGAMVNQALRHLIKKVNKLSPEVCIVDMPPGTGDIQMKLCSELKPSAAILVSQTNNLSKQDANRAMQLFMVHRVPVIGIIENMIGDIFGKSSKDTFLGLPVLASMKLEETLASMGNAGKIYDAKNPFKTKYKKILSHAKNISWEIKKTTLLEGPTSIFDIIMDDKKYHLQFYGTNTWDKMCLIILKEIPFPDHFLIYCTAEKIRQMLDGLDEEGNGLFMVIKSPHTSVRLFPGEIGHVTFSIYDNEHYYNVPRVRYQTDKGEITLFPHEVAPMSTDDLLAFRNDGELIRMPGSSTVRYIPTYKMMKQVEFLYGNLAGTPKNWEKLYQEIGITK